MLREEVYVPVPGGRERGWKDRVCAARLMRTRFVAVWRELLQAAEDRALLLWGQMLV